MSDSLPTTTLSIIPWQSKTRASEPELRPASDVHAQLEHGQDNVPGWWSGSEADNFIDVTLLLLTWYRLFRRCDPPKDEEDINELQELAHWYLNLSKNI